MARLATGLSVIAVARNKLREATTSDELRRAQAGIFPLDVGLSMEKTAQAIGLSRGWACQLRRSFIKGQLQPKSEQLPRRKPGSGRGRS